MKMEALCSSEEVVTTSKTMNNIYMIIIPQICMPSQ
jgi:hypothetical protein